VYAFFFFSSVGRGIFSVVVFVNASIVGKKAPEDDRRNDEESTLPLLGEFV